MTNTPEPPIPSLLPCPFCGGESYWLAGMSINCRGCNACMLTNYTNGNTRDVISNQWNTRGHRTPDREGDNREGKGYCDHGFGSFSCSVCFPPQDRDGLIEKLENLRITDKNKGYMGALTRWHISSNVMLDKCIALIRQHDQMILPQGTQDIGGPHTPQGLMAGNPTPEIVRQHEAALQSDTSNFTISQHVNAQHIKHDTVACKSGRNPSDGIRSCESPASPSEIRSDMDIAETHSNSEWMPPTLKTIERWQKHEAISRRDWVNVLALLEGYMKPVPPITTSEIPDAERLVELIGDSWNEAKIHDNSPRWAVYNAMRPYLATWEPVSNEMRLTKEEWADNILAELKTEGNRTKVDEWEAAYAMLFKQLNSLPKPMVSNERLLEEIENLRIALDAERSAKVAEQPVGMSEVNIDAGAKACSLWYSNVRYAFPTWDKLTESQQDEYRAQAKACAEAWGLPWK